MINNTDPSYLPHSRAELQGTVQFLFSEDAASPGDAITRGYLDLGVFLGCEIKTDPKRTEIKKASRGVVFTSGTTGTEVTLGLELTTKEVADQRKLKFMLMATPATNFTQPILAAVAVDPLVFTAPNPAKLNHAYPVTQAGVRIREITTIVVGTAPLIAGTDYVLDAKAGYIRFIKTATLPVASTTVTVTAPAITATDAAYMEGLIPMQLPRRRGYAHILVWDNDSLQKLVKEYEPRPVDIFASGGAQISHENQSEFKLMVNFTSNAERVLVRP